MEAERRASRRCRSRARCRAGLLPQQAPSLKTLDCAGKCIQTRAVGGDYYDFLDFGSGRLGLVLADISGKGMSAALLMANLQANLRGQYALALEDIPRLLRSVNHLFYKNTETSNYATMFFAVYDDETRRLRYVNCGHNPPDPAAGEWRRRAADGHRNRVGTVRGMGLHRGRVQTRARRCAGDLYRRRFRGGRKRRRRQREFGEERLIAAIRKHQQQSADEILEGILGEVQHFSPGEQADDMTLIVARGR